MKIYVLSGLGFLNGQDVHSAYVSRDLARAAAKKHEMPPGDHTITEVELEFPGLDSARPIETRLADLEEAVWDLVSRHNDEDSLARERAERG